MEEALVELLAESKGTVMFCEYAKQTSQGRENFKATALKLFLTESVLTVPPIELRSTFVAESKPFSHIFERLLS
ncbi:MAG: hypothetical protein AAB511_04330 [Patescibacteria group bacterium]